MYMAEKRFLRHIDISKVNMALFSAIMLIIIVFHGPLLWAVRQLPLYLKGRIDAPLETRQCHEAAAILSRGGDISGALPLLQRSISVDPNSEALFWLGEYYSRKGEPDRAILFYSQYRGINPLDGAACLSLARLYELKGEPGKARAVLEEGLESYRRVKDYEPVIDGTVNDRYNRKAGQAFKSLVDSDSLLRRELTRLKSGD
jgi:tetratricopeptide (TPR) repeat protein